MSSTAFFYGANFLPGPRHVAFWDVLDYIGVDAYYPLVVTSADTTLLKEAWQPFLDDLRNLSESWGKKVVFNEVGEQMRVVERAAVFSRKTDDGRLINNWIKDSIVVDFGVILNLGAFVVLLGLARHKQTNSDTMAVYLLFFCVLVLFYVVDNFLLFLFFFSLLSCLALLFSFTLLSSKGFQSISKCFLLSIRTGPVEVDEDCQWAAYAATMEVLAQVRKRGEEERVGEKRRKNIGFSDLFCFFCFFAIWFCYVSLKSRFTAFCTLSLFPVFSSFLRSIWVCFLPCEGPTLFIVLLYWIL